MQKENGNISIHTENILPIIKKWLYSDKDIFIRELISNGCDAISKLKNLVSLGEAKMPDDTKYEVHVSFNKENKTLVFTDNGIGMTAEEVKKYINQVAFSGAEDFINKYKDKLDEQNQIIGHFGLGFYSAFMVADKVQIDTLSYQDGAEAVQWECLGGTEYELNHSPKSSIGSTITLYLNEDSIEFLEEYKLSEIIKKYCYFLPYEIFLHDETPKKEDDEKKDTEKKDETETEIKPLNEIHPLWLKNPKDCTDEEYKEFYKTVFHDFNEPLFWIHLHVDYPFNLKGILYFPKIKHEFETVEGQIKLYNNQVFVADNIKEVIPEFLMLLKGTIDCNDLPLNVSRSFLQGDRTVAKISKHITKKVADKLTDLFKNQRDSYNNFWDDINPFIKYGCIREHDFYEKVKDILIYKTTAEAEENIAENKKTYTTIKEYLERNKEKHENKVFYANNENQQAQYIKMFKENDLEAIILSSTIDSHFIQFLESQESSVKFNRIDSDLSETLKESKPENESKEDAEKQKQTNDSLEKIFKTALKNDKIKIQVEALKMESTPAVILLSEQSRRMQEMSMMFGGGMDMKSMFPDEQTLVLNKNNNLVQAILRLNGDSNSTDDINLFCEQIYDLAMMSHKPLEPEAMSKFIERSTKIMSKLV